MSCKIYPRGLLLWTDKQEESFDLQTILKSRALFELYKYNVLIQKNYLGMLEVIITLPVCIVVPPGLLSFSSRT